MEFQEYAAREVSALIERLVSDAEGRTATLLDGLRHEHEEAIASVRAQLDAQREQLEARIREKDQLAADVEDSLTRLEAQSRQLEVRTREKEQLAADVEDAAAQIAASRAETETQRASLESQQRDAEQQRRNAVAAGAAAKQELLLTQAALKAAAADAERLQTEHEQVVAAANASAAEDLLAVQSALHAAQAEAERLEAEHERALSKANASARQELLAAQSALHAAQRDAERLEAEHRRSLATGSASAAKEVSAARAALDSARADLQRRDSEHERSIAAARQAADEALLQARRAADEELQQARRAADEELQHARHAAGEDLRQARQAAGEELQDVRSALAAAQAESQRLAGQFDGALDELRQEHLSTLQQQAVARTVLPLDELLAVFNSLASASTPSGVLTTVVSGLGREFSRVALFRVRGSRLECVSHVGFEFEGDVAKVAIPMSVDSLMTRALSARATQTFIGGSSDEACAVPFGGTPACAVALPLISGDAPVAVVYADDSDQLEFGSVPGELLVKFADLVWQHAILVLQRASAAQKMLAVAPVQSFERPA